MKNGSHDQWIPTRREFLARSGLGLGAVGLSTLLNAGAIGQAASGKGTRFLHFAPRAKRVIYLFQSGAPSQIELFDHKPVLNERFGEELPESVRRGQRLTGMTAGQSSFPLAGSKW